MYTALRSTSLTLAEILRQHFIADNNLRAFFDPSAGGTMVISLNSPQELTENQGQGLSVWLYRVNRDGETLNAPRERNNRTQLRRHPLPVCLHYLLTPIVATNNPASAETEQLILGKGLQVLHDHPILRGAELQDDFIGTAVELHVRLELLSLEEISRVYDALDRSYQLSISYEVSVVLIESGHQPEDTSIVEVVIPRYGIIIGN